jgi:hypothetical protein
MRDYEQKMALLRERNAREEAASAARRKKEAVGPGPSSTARRKKEARGPGPSVAKLLRQLDLRSQRIKAEQQKQHWGTGPLKEWESEQAPYKLETPDPHEKE